MATAGKTIPRIAITVGLILLLHAAYSVVHYKRTVADLDRRSLAAAWSSSGGVFGSLQSQLLLAFDLTLPLDVYAELFAGVCVVLAVSLGADEKNDEVDACIPSSPVQEADSSLRILHTPFHTRAFSSKQNLSAPLK